MFNTPISKDATKCSVAAFCDGGKKEGLFDGKELYLIQLPKPVSSFGYPRKSVRHLPCKKKRN